MNKKTIIEIAIAIIVIAIGVWGYLFWKKMKTPQEKTLQAVEQSGDVLNTAATQGVLPSLDAGKVNPLENNPNLNPVDQTNPFNDVKTNPFAQ